MSIDLCVGVWYNGDGDLWCHCWTSLVHACMSYLSRPKRSDLCSM